MTDNDKADIKAMLAFVEIGPTSSGSTKIEDIVAGVEDLIPDELLDEFDEADEKEQLHVFCEICEYLNEIAPEGVSFGASEGDGACFGFWKDEVRDEMDCPYRNNQLLGDDMSCSITFGCNKGFDPGQLEQGDILTDIVCWLDEEED